MIQIESYQRKIILFCYPPPQKKTNKQKQKPTALAKVLGFYKVGFHNPVTNTAQKLDLLVQENLFYKRRIAQVFDLKGSMRNRHVKTMGAQTGDLVLMDENLRKRKTKFRCGRTWSQFV